MTVGQRRRIASDFRIRRNGTFKGSVKGDAIWFGSGVKRHAELFELRPLIRSELRPLIGCPAVGGFYWLTRFFDQKKTFPKVKKLDLLAIPLPPINFRKPDGKDQHHQLIRLVDKMLANRDAERTAKRPQEKEQLRRGIAATDRQIDQLAYQLYGLTEEEVRLVESATEPAAGWRDLVDAG